MSKQRNFYEVLNSTPNSSFDELKSNYKLLILQCHPDKLQQDKVKEMNTNNVGATVDPVVDADENAEFVMINKAWNTLKDPVKRKHYDAELLLTKFQMHSNIFERLTLNDMTEHEDISDVEEVETAVAVERNKLKKNIGQTQNNQDSTESESESKLLSPVSYFYTYNCRCGGQYIIDESAAADNGIYKRNISNNTTNSNKMLASQQQNAKQTTYSDNVDDKGKTAAGDVEVMVECSECSLVITLSNGKQKSKTSDSTMS